MKYTQTDLDSHAIADLIADANAAERQANEGPFYPDRGITRENLISYAKECRQSAAKYSQGGAHEAVLKGLK
jgi:hypothetical protein